jgi:hypothetical protein
MIRKMKEFMRKVVKENGWENCSISVKTKVLRPDEAIGNPEHDDYPILKGRERLMQADFRTGSGVAFTDMFGNYEATLSEIAEIDLSNNFRRAVFVASLNALLNELGLISKTKHCKDSGPVQCGKQVVQYMLNTHLPKTAGGSPKDFNIFMVGLQPRLLEAIAQVFTVKATDMDEQNVGKTIGGVTIEPVANEPALLKWCDMVFATGSTFVNDTAQNLMTSGKKVVFFGVTCAAAAHILGCDRFCPEGI